MNGLQTSKTHREQKKQRVLGGVNVHLDEIIRHFDNPKPNGANSFMVRCPCHNDKHQSLSITEKDGKILMNCFAGCNSRDILWAAGLRERDLFNNDQRKPDNRPESAEYHYGPDLKKIRFYTKSADGWRKTFCWKHLDENGEWQKGMGGKTPPLYTQYKLDLVRRRSHSDRLNTRVPEEGDCHTPEGVRNDTSFGGDLFEDEPWKTVFIVEGEKDVDTVNHKLGLDAVCSPHGGSKGDLKSKWKPEYSPLFEGLDVAIIPDNDEVGQQFASMVAKEILPYAKSVRIVDLTREWPDLKEKGDITDVYESEIPTHGRTIADQVRDKLEALTLIAPSFRGADSSATWESPCHSDRLNTRVPEEGDCHGAKAPRNDNHGSDEWEPPVPFTDYKLPEFPVDALPPVIRAYAVSAAESVQVPVDMCASACLAVLALTMQGKYTIMGKEDWYEPLNLYVLCIAPPSERKSTILSKVTDPINSYEADYNRRHALEIENSQNDFAVMEKTRERMLSMIADKKAGKKGAAKKLEKAEETLGDYEKKVAELTEEILNFHFKKSMKLYCEDITPEKLSSVLEENDGRIGILSSEGGIFEIMKGAYSSNKEPKIDVFLQAWSGDSIRVDRVGRASNNIEHPALTMLLMVQPHVISGLVNNKTFSGRGLTARFLYCMPKSAVGHRRYRTAAIPETVKESYTELLTNLLDDEINDARVPKLIRLSDEADKLLEEFYNRTEPQIPAEYAELSGWMGKLVGTVLRIAGIITRALAADRIARASFDEIQDMDTDTDNLLVSGDTMKGAIAIGEYYLEHARAAFSLMGGDEVTSNAMFALEVIGRKGLNGFKTADLMRASKKFKTADATNEVLKRLTEMGYLRKETPESKKSGRPPAPKYTVNPIWLEALSAGALG